MKRTDARRTAGRAWTVADQLGRILEELPVQLIETSRKSDAPWIDLEYGHGRQLRGHGTDLGHRSEVSRVAHQPQACDEPQRMGHALEARLQSLTPKRAPQNLVGRDPGTGPVTRLR